MLKEIRTTKDGAETIKELLALLDIKSEVSIVGKSARLISFDYDKDAIKSKLSRNAGRKLKSNLSGVELYLEVKKNGAKAVAEKEGVTERAIYKRLKKWTDCPEKISKEVKI